MTKFKLAYSYLFFLLIFTATDAFNPIGNIIMSSIGFFNPLLRVFKSFYSMEKNSSSKIRYNYIKHLGYEHLQSASNQEVGSSINHAKSRKLKKKLLFFHEETANTTLNITDNNKILNDTTQKQILNLIQNFTNETNTFGDLTPRVNRSNTLRLINRTNSILNADEKIHNKTMNLMANTNKFE
ncbi:unnamed protein product [Cryptosporidium hominis]|uniref:Uncharacterized protein n=1 Tax=Cryptosporidium hominis TaxID=237895 RepID=A0A0S4TGP9_CRYHO|nr:hypothetical protein ChTU502y2012_295g0470 [Cryptosporidium hominis]PPA64277.1 hypothetical protein ChUKH1_03890 [Cryptosporidium hominis]CUV05648.1 unnamed protein product [Cryptosporidium hominis]